MATAASELEYDRKERGDAALLTSVTRSRSWSRGEVEAEQIDRKRRRIPSGEIDEGGGLTASWLVALHVDEEDDEAHLLDMARRFGVAPRRVVDGGPAMAVFDRARERRERRRERKSEG
jgi:hypothetical protein